MFSQPQPYPSLLSERLMIGLDLLLNSMLWNLSGRNIPESTCPFTLKRKYDGRFIILQTLFTEFWGSKVVPCALCVSGLPQGTEGGSELDTDTVCCFRNKSTVVQTLRPKRPILKTSPFVKVYNINIHYFIPFQTLWGAGEVVPCYSGCLAPMQFREHMYLFPSTAYMHAGRQTDRHTIWWKQEEVLLSA